MNSDFDFEFPRDANFDNVYLVEITASDGVNSSTQLLAVSVNDVDFEPFFLIPEMTTLEENLQLDLGMIGVDPEGQETTASITGGADADLFEVSTFPFSDLQFLQFIEIADFETPLDSDGDNIYEVEVTLSDGTNSVSQLVSIEITDLFESPNAPIFTTADTLSLIHI